MDAKISYPRHFLTDGMGDNFTFKKEPPVSFVDSDTENRNNFNFWRVHRHAVNLIAERFPDSPRSC